MNYQKNLTWGLAMLLAFGVSTLGVSTTGTTLADDDWMQFRGSGGLSVAEGSIPKTFSETENVAWKVPLPAKGASGPIVVGNKVVVTCSGGPRQDQLFTLCLDAKSGKELWRQEFWATGRCFVHPLSANAAPTPASDGKHVFAFFSSNDLACLDLDGNLLWYRGLAVDFPKAGNDVGMSSSPIVTDGVVVVQVECQGDSFAMGIDAATGKTLWTQERAREAMWSSPLVAEKQGKSYVLLQSKSSFDVLDPKTGQRVFKADGEVSSISSAAAAGDRLFVPVNGTTAYAISADGSLSKEWNNREIRPSSMSAVVHKNKIYSINRAGGLFVYDAANGESVAKTRVVSGSTLWATPVVVDDHMYVFTQGGTGYVVDLQNPKKPTVTHKHKFEDEVFLGSPAISNNAMFLRSDKFLYKIAN